MRRALFLAVAVFLLLPATPSFAGDPSADLARAQKAANDAAAKSNAAQTAMARTQHEADLAKQDLAAAKSQIGGLESRVRAMAVASFTGTTHEHFVFDANDISQAARGQAMLDTLSESDGEALDSYRAAQADIESRQAALDQAVSDQRKAASELKKQNDAAKSEVSRLTAAYKAFQAQQASAKKKAAAAKGGNSGKDVGRIIGSGNWVCPVQGPHAFSNDFGAPRGGGTRRHQGNDILSPRGTPVVANVSGTLKRHDNNLGGISYYLTGSDGNEYYGAHLQDMTLSGGGVSAGQVIGHVGNTGDAAGGPTHLHFEIHPGGGGAVSPYATLKQYC